MDDLNKRKSRSEHEKSGRYAGAVTAQRILRWQQVYDIPNKVLPFIHPYIHKLTHQPTVVLWIEGRGRRQRRTKVADQVLTANLCCEKIPSYWKKNDVESNKKLKGIEICMNW